MSRHDMAVFQLYPKHGVGESIDNFSIHLNLIFFRHKTLQ